MKKFLFICLTALSLASCGEEKKKEIVPVQLKHEVIDLPDAIMGSVGDIRKIGSYLIVLDFRTDSIFHLIDVKKKVYHGMFGGKGQGPNEFIHPEHIHAFGDGRFTIFDAMRKDLKEIKLDSINKKLTFSRITLMKNKDDWDVAPLPDGNFVTWGLYDGPKFNVVDKEGNIVAQGGEHPYKDEAEKKIHNILRAMAYQGFFRVNKDGKMAHVTSGTGQILSIYQPSAKGITPIAEVVERYADYKPNDHPPGAYSVSNNGNSPETYQGVHVTDDFIYALYSGRKFADYKSDACMNCEHIHIFDWEGNQVGAYKLDVAVNSFFLDETENRIYAIADLPNPVVVVFDL